MTTSAYRFNSAHESAWRANDPGLLESMIWTLTPSEVEELESAIAPLEHHHGPLESLNRADFPLPTFSGRLEEIRHSVLHGKGIAVVKGIPVAGRSLAHIERLYWCLGTWLGQAVSQSVMGDLVGHVTDVSGKDPNERAYRNSLSLPLHTDISDMVAMLSIRPAKEGGLSTFASAAAIHNEMLATRPDLLEPLYRGYRMHLFGEELPGEPPVTAHRVPVLSMSEGLVSTRIVPEYIDMAEVELGEPLPGLDREALDTFLRIAERADMRLDLMLEPGDLSLINNYAVLHARTLFNDFEVTDKKRYLMRLWLMCDDRRPVDESAFDVRSGGITPQLDRDNSYFEGETAMKANRGRYGEGEL
jgi:hypothetical protein